MKEIVMTKYESEDGILFDSKSACLNHELLTAEIDLIMEKLPVLPRGQFEGYIQHDPKTFMEVRKELLLIANRIYPHDWFDQAIQRGNDVHPSYPGRMIDEIGSRPLNRAWYRIMSTDSMYREWNQPYYANNNGGVMKRIN